MSERISPEELSLLLRLDTETGNVFWIKVPRNHSEKLGKNAGNKNPSRGKFYWVIRINGASYKRSHVVFCLTYGRWPSQCIDHINGNSLDDRPANIREATVTQNAWNHKRRAKKSKYPMGVRLSTSGKKFEARIGFCKKQISIGTFDTAAEASMAYQAKRKELYSEFA
jgi:hypothetical protein